MKTYRFLNTIIVAFMTLLANGISAQGLYIPSELPFSNVITDAIQDAGDNVQKVPITKKREVDVKCIVRNNMPLYVKVKLNNVQNYSRMRDKLTDLYMFHLKCTGQKDNLDVYIGCLDDTSEPFGDTGVILSEGDDGYFCIFSSVRDCMKKMASAEPLFEDYAKKTGKEVLYDDKESPVFTDMPFDYWIAESGEKNFSFYSNSIFFLPLPEITNRENSGMFLENIAKSMIPCEQIGNMKTLVARIPTDDTIHRVRDVVNGYVLLDKNDIKQALFQFRFRTTYDDIQQKLTLKAKLSGSFNIGKVYTEYFIIPKNNMVAFLSMREPSYTRGFRGDYVLHYIPLQRGLSYVELLKTFTNNINN